VEDFGDDEDEDGDGGWLDDLVASGVAGKGDDALAGKSSSGSDPVDTNALLEAWSQNDPSDWEDADSSQFGYVGSCAALSRALSGPDASAGLFLSYGERSAADLANVYGFVPLDSRQWMAGLLASSSCAGRKSDSDSCPPTHLPWESAVIQTPIVATTELVALGSMAELVGASIAQEDAKPGAVLSAECPSFARIKSGVAISLAREMLQGSASSRIAIGRDAAALLKRCPRSVSQSLELDSLLAPCRLALASAREIATGAFDPYSPLPTVERELAVWKHIFEMASKAFLGLDASNGVGLFSVRKCWFWQRFA